MHVRYNTVHIVQYHTFFILQGSTRSHIMKRDNKHDCFAPCPSSRRHHHHQVGHGIRKATNKNIKHANHRRKSGDIVRAAHSLSVHDVAAVGHASMWGHAAGGRFSLDGSALCLLEVRREAS